MAALAFGAHGLVRRPDLLDAAVSSDQIRWRLGIGALIAEFPGVYRVGHRAPSLEATYLAAVWACGPEAYLIGLAAARLYELIAGPPPMPQVAAPTERRIEGIRTRRSRRTHPLDVTRHLEIPVTTVPRTIADVTAGLDETDLARLCDRAGILFDVTPDLVERVLGRRPNTPGAAKLRRVLHGDIPVTLSELERAFLGLLERHGLPRPDVNRRVGRHRVDCRWERPPLVVELDGYRFHRSRHRWELDRQRERDARTRGYEYRRFTWRDVIEDPRYLLAELVRLLGPG